MKIKNKVSITKEIFIKSIKEIEKQQKHDDKCAKALRIVFPDNYITQYDNHWLQNQLIEILKIATNDNNKDSWIEYYIWELDFGRKWKKGSVEVNGKNFKLHNPNDLWNLLNIGDTK